MKKDERLPKDPIPDCGEERVHQYVTMESARKASHELAAIACNRDDMRLWEMRRELYNEIIDTYIPFGKPTGKDATANLQFAHCLIVCIGSNETYKEHSIMLSGSGCKQVLPTEKPVKVSLAHFLAVEHIDNLKYDLVARQRALADSIFTEIMFMRDKLRIEYELPEIVGYLEFKPFTYDTEFWKDVLSKERQDEYDERFIANL